MSISLRCQDLSCGYHRKTILTGINLTVAPGEVVALLGPNGSGKSTLLKTIVRNIPLLGGTVEVQGRPLGEISFRELAREIAFVPQEEFSYFPFRVEEVVMMGRIPHSGRLLDSQEDHDAVSDAMQRADCQFLHGRSVLELSGGEKQRVWIARALAQGARILLMDEPSAHLDFSHQVALVGLLKDLALQGLSIVAAVHDMNIAAALEGRGVLISGGAILIDGPIGDVLSNPSIEEVYQVKFDRYQTATGKLRVFPPL